MRSEVFRMNCTPFDRVIAAAGSKTVTLAGKVMLTDMVCGLAKPRASMVHPALGQSWAAALTFEPKSVPACKLASITVVPLPKPDPPPGGVAHNGVPAVEIWFKNWPVVQLMDSTPPNALAVGV